MGKLHGIDPRKFFFLSQIYMQSHTQCSGPHVRCCWLNTALMESSIVDKKYPNIKEWRMTKFCNGWHNQSIILALAQSWLLNASMKAHYVWVSLGCCLRLRLVWIPLFVFLVEGWSESEQVDSGSVTSKHTDLQLRCLWMFKMLLDWNKVS